MFAVIDIVTGNQLMHVIDAVNPNDPAWNPQNSIQISVPIAQYQALTFEALDALVIQQGLAKGVTVKPLVNTQVVTAPPAQGQL